MVLLKYYHIKQLITLTSNKIKRLLLIYSERNDELSLFKKLLEFFLSGSNNCQLINEI